MGSVSSEDELDQPSDRCEFDGYSFSADVSESESSGSFSCRHYDRSGGASTSLPSPVAGGFFSHPSLPIMLPVVDGNHVMIPMKKEQKQYADLSDAGMIKERFAKLLLGEDMSGGGNGVCTALAISNAITNLSASVFGEQWKLEPLAPQKKSMWHQEMELLLCVSNYIVELVPSIQEFPGGGTFDIMAPQPRLDLFVNLPALKKLDGMLLNILDGFHGSEFYYVDRGVIVAGGNETKIFPVSSSSSISCEEKWWLPFPKVPRNGLSGDARKRLQQSKECTSQILKAAMAINDSVLAEMETPNAYLASLPKSGKACLGENIYREITANRFSLDSLLDYLDLSSEYSTLEIANRIEAASHIWRRKCVKGDNRGRSRAGKRSTWGGRVRGFVGEVERNELLATRAEAVLRSLKLRFPALPQTILDMHKIQYNKDVGYAIIESYSRVMESLAFNIMARIDDLLYVDDATKQRAAAESLSLYDQGGAIPKQKQMSPDTFSSQHSFAAPSLQAFDSCHDKSRMPNSRAHHFRKRNRLRDSAVQALQRLTF